MCNNNSRAFKVRFIINRISELNNSNDDELIDILYDYLSKSRTGFDLSCRLLNDTYNDYIDNKDNLNSLKVKAQSCKTLCYFLKILLELHGIKKEEDAKTFNSRTANSLPNKYNSISKN